MNIVLLVVGIIAGAIIGYLTAGRKAAALKTQVEAAEEREALLNRTAEERITRERSIAEERLQEANRQASERLSAQERLFAERISEQAEISYAVFCLKKKMILQAANDKDHVSYTHLRAN